MAKTNSKKVILADNLGRIVAEIVSSKTKEYLNKGYILLGFSSIVSGGLFKVSLFEDSSLENEFRVIIVETNHVKALEDEIFKKVLSIGLSLQKFIQEQYQKKSLKKLHILEKFLKQIIKLKFTVFFLWITRFLFLLMRRVRLLKNELTVTKEQLNGYVIIIMIFPNLNVVQFLGKMT